MEDATMLWNGLLTIATGSFVWWIRGINSQISDIRKLVSQTREEIPKIYATKIDVEKIMDRFDRLDDKMDNILERMTRD